MSEFKNQEGLIIYTHRNRLTSQGHGIKRYPFSSRIIVPVVSDCVHCGSERLYHIQPTICHCVVMRTLTSDKAPLMRRNGFSPPFRGQMMRSKR
ncbi:hypothetical protein M413DRAFT_320402 [Hebeloma cylindrosporum]|uniref:Uncharacterized protein n=1 Tax=Hebeloma cylindrosporum TaxID=76867 RepID=A0A0C3BXK0_HEBCY|nr:hypothetical protein M413DRAFT_320402 [Hebeloma cylindrosporum h7]